MRAIIWKEIRENLKYAVLWMLGAALAMAYVLYLLSTPFNWGSSQSLLSGGFQIITIFGAAAGAALLGFLQTLPELWRDQWAFLVHRPISRRRLFLGKVIAGLTLYGGAMLLPFLGAAIWAATPGHIAAPFHWRLLVPGLADVLGGVAFYFAALLIGVRQARWYGSRALPLALAILCEACVVGATEFWHAAAVVALCVAVLATAAYSSFAASGQYRSQSEMAKAALGIVLLVGVVCLGGFGAVILETVFWRPSYGGYHGYRVDKEGRIFRVDFDPYSGYLRSVTDLAGNPVDAAKGKRYFEFWGHRHLDFQALRTDWTGERAGTYRNVGRFFAISNASPHEVWYDVPAERLLVGYESKSRRRIGTLGPGGFSPVGATPSQRLPNRRCYPFWQETDVLAFPQAAYHIDFNNRQVTVLLAGTSDQPILSAHEIRRADDGQPTRFIGVVTANRIYLFSGATRSPVSCAYHYPSTEYPVVQWAALPKGGYVLWYQPSWRQRASHARPEHVVVVSATGTETARYDLPPITQPTSIPPWSASLLASFVPVAGVVSWFTFLAIARWLGDPDAVEAMRDTAQALSGDETAFWIVTGVVLIVGALLWALLVFAIARRYLFTERQTWGWTIAGFLLGPAGVLTFLVLREWPARVVCPSCGRMRVVDQEKCGHCGAAFPPPAPTGTELFDGHVPERSLAQVQP